MSRGSGWADGSGSGGGDGGGCTAASMGSGGSGCLIAGAGGAGGVVGAGGVEAARCGSGGGCSAGGGGFDTPRWSGGARRDIFRPAGEGGNKCAPRPRMGWYVSSRRACQRGNMREIRSYFRRESEVPWMKPASDFTRFGAKLRPEHFSRYEKVHFNYRNQGARVLSVTPWWLLTKSALRTRA